MAVIKLGSAQESVGKYAVIGCYQHSTSFVRHVGLSSCTAMLEIATTASVHHMRPPLSFDHSMPAELVGELELTPDERRDIEDWLQEIKSEKARIPYIARPSELKRDENGRVIGRAFSCASFVESAYSKGANIHLIDLQSLPQLGWEVLGEIYPVGADDRAKYGLPGDGPWDVLLSGHLFHSLKRPNPRVGPMAAQAGQECYP